MGFLTVNTRLRPKSIRPSASKDERPRSRNSRSTSPPLCDVKSQDPLKSSASIETIPQEILERIFALSGNLQFPQTSLVLARRLSRTRILEIKLLRAQLTEDNALPVSIMYWQFVDTDLLERIGTEYFTDTRGSRTPMLPFGMEQRICAQYHRKQVSTTDPCPQIISLAAYMVRCGCLVEDAFSMYDIFLRERCADAVLKMCRNGQLAERRNVCFAIVLGMEDIAQRIFDVCPKYSHVFFKNYVEYVRSRAHLVKSDMDSHLIYTKICCSFVLDQK